MMTPSTPGVYKFEGKRQYSKRKDLVSVRAVVEVRRYQWGAKWDLAVFFFGRQNPYRLDLFEGKWELLPVEFEGGMAQ